MLKILNIILEEISNTYHQYLFNNNNNTRRKRFKQIINVLLCFSCLLIGYKLRDSTLLVQKYQISNMIIKKNQLYNDIDKLQNNLEEYNFLINDGDYYRYLAHKHSNILINKNVNSEDLKLLTEQAEKYNIPLKYIYRLVHKESNYNPNALSHAGASGYMQIMPETFKIMKNKYVKKYGDIDIFNNKQQNILIGTFTLYYLHKKYNNWRLVFAAYNAGSARVDKINDVPNIPETQNYVKYIMKN